MTTQSEPLADYFVALAQIERDHVSTPAQRLARRITMAIEREPGVDAQLAAQLRAVLNGGQG